MYSDSPVGGTPASSSRRPSAVSRTIHASASESVVMLTSVKAPSGPSTTSVLPARSWPASSAVTVPSVGEYSANVASEP